MDVQAAGFIEQRARNLTNGFLLDVLFAGSRETQLVCTTNSSAFILSIASSPRHTHAVFCFVAICSPL